MAPTEEHPRPFRLTEEDIHPHLRARMVQRGVTMEEIERTVAGGRPVTEARPGTCGRARVFPYAAEWQGRFHREKEVTVYYRQTGERIVVLTVIARYGQGFAEG